VAELFTTQGIVVVQNLRAYTTGRSNRQVGIPENGGLHAMLASE
jgi:hypothetical protein